MKKYIFPTDFLWGVATSAHQIEGLPLVDGCGKSIWYTFSHTPGNIKDGSTIDVACNFYNMWKKDILLMKYLGIKSYRFSISWSRILPHGFGKINKKAIDFYNRIIDELLKHGIIPMVTIYHWELPVELQYRGGWLNNEIADWFAEYAFVLFKYFSDRVKLWITINEPISIVLCGYILGIHPPSMRDINFAFRCVYNLVRAHGKAVGVFREIGVKNGKIGIAVNCMPVFSATKKKIDVKVAKRLHSFYNELVLDLIFFGQYPENILKFFGEEITPLSTEDRKIITTPFDFVGLNYYTRAIVKYSTNNFLNCEYVKNKKGSYTKMGWEIYPKGLYEILAWLNKNYNPKEIYITENGASFDDRIVKDKVDDYKRVKFLKEHIKYLYKAIKDYNNIKGYYVWSLMDNYEWAEGFTQRFGLIYVDFNTQKRIIKKSGFWYRKFIIENLNK